MGEPGDEPAPGGGPVAAEAGERSGLVVVRNGRVVHHALDAALEAQGVRVCGLATCEREEVASSLGACSDASPDAFTVLHDAFLAGGAFVKVPRGVVVDQPIVILHWSEGDGLASFPHTLVVADEGAEVTVFDRYGSTDTGSGTTGHLVDAVVELIVGDNAHVRYLSVQEHGATHLADCAAARAPRSGRLVEVVGGRARRCLRAAAQRVAASSGQGAESDLTAVYFGDGSQMLDFRTLQDHDAPNTRSDLLFKGAVEDTAQSVYSGLIRIRKHAQKSNAFQTNRNLVLTEGAEAKSVPNLEIEADDVKCSHASTVGPVDEDQLYYLATRGVPPEEAERLIVLGFFDDVFDRLPVPSLVAPLASQRRREDRAPRSDRASPCLTRACARSATSKSGTAARFDVDGHRLCVVQHRRHVLRDRRRVLARRLLADRRRGVGGRA